MKIIKTNWINIVGVFIAVFLYAIALNLMDENASRNMLQSVFASLILVFGYGIIFWGLLIVSLIVLDLLLFIRSQNNLKAKLVIEWLIISSPFVYWAIRYKEWIFVAAIVALLITQLLREKKIQKATS
ncbi:hypothetical protein SAMN05444410_1284 [Hydrobacter penzbergensis]|uniref:Uncharacterized protein n=1 Tax=Hydrobacter penzbergensis TaxID=1235997 RepID=A0A8X8IKX1_9BACT|nr:hypothetical protein [Hydrobacter penzbergensis]SDX69575.1 hypothetical protein SAMN05444410_1284 [Hydrobacter penzbergensis]